MSRDLKDMIVLACDVGSARECLKLVDFLKTWVGWFKIGLQLFCAEGPSIVNAVKGRGGRVFLDLKFHDIPNTVSKAVRSAVSAGADMITVHTAGGDIMLKAAVAEAGNSGSVHTMVFGVTVLTSLNQEILTKEIGVHASLNDTVVAYARRAWKCGLHGVVASPHEIKAIKTATEPAFCVLTPGIRLSDAQDDQQRKATPYEAVSRGADFIVVGRAVTEAKNPSAQAEEIYQQVDQAMRDRLNKGSNL